MRITSKDVKIVFTHLCKALGKKAGHGVGDWFLDYAPCYGGYSVREILEGGGEEEVFLRRRLKAEAFYNAAHFALEALEIKERNSTL